MNKVICLDASTKMTGVSFWENGKYSSSTLIDVSHIQDTEDRIYNMCLSILDQLQWYKPNNVFIEDTYCGNNPKTQKMLDRIQGVVYGWCIKNKCFFELVSPTSWRKYIPGFPTKAKRKELKDYSVEYVNEHFGIKCNDDVADSILIGEAMMRKYE